MACNFINSAEAEMIPILEALGAKLTKKIPTQISFEFKDFEVSFYFEREFELYSVITLKKSQESVYVSEIMLECFEDNESVVFQVSENISLNLCMRKLVNTITTQIIPLIEDGIFFEVMNTVIQKRKERLVKCNENLIEKNAEKAFKDKRYEDVISYYSQIHKLNEIQKKRLAISELKISQ